VIGHAWFAALFVVGALGGAAGSLAANAPNVLSVGASGAIMALLAAALVCSFIFESVQLRRRMQKVSLRFLIPSLAPALLPLGVGAFALAQDDLRDAMLMTLIGRIFLATALSLDALAIFVLTRITRIDP